MRYRAFALVSFAALALGQDTKPNFNGAWRSVGVTLGPLTKSITDIKQTASTFEIRVMMPNRSSTGWSVYPTDGTKLKKKIGRIRIERTGHWEGDKLTLEETSPGNAPWRRSTERRVISLDKNAGIMTIRFHNMSDKRGLHDYAVQSQKIDN